MWWHLFSLEMIRTRGRHAHVQSECVHTSAVKSTKYQVPVSNTVREATGFRSTPTSIHKYPRSVSCHVPRCPIPSQHNSHRMRFNELPQNTYRKKGRGEEVVEMWSWRVFKSVEKVWNNDEHVTCRKCVEKVYILKPFRKKVPKKFRKVLLRFEKVLKKFGKVRKSSSLKKVLKAWKCSDGFFEKVLIRFEKFWTFFSSKKCFNKVLKVLNVFNGFESLRSFCKFQ